MTEAQAEPAVASHPPKHVDLTAIERELSQLWKLPGTARRSAEAVTRACMSNLLIYCTSEEQASGLPDELDVIVRVHPSRVLLLIGDTESATTGIAAYVSAHCHLAGDRHQVCSEQVTVSASGDAVPRLPSTARSLLIGDLPTSLWWADPRPPSLGGDVFDELKDMHQTLITATPERVEQVLLPRLLERIAEHLVPLRPGRHYPRTKDTYARNRRRKKRKESTNSRKLPSMKA